MLSLGCGIGDGMSGRERRPFIYCGDIADKSESPPMHRPNEALRPSVIADRLTRGLEAGRNGRFGDDPALPNRVDDLVPADDAVAVACEEMQQIEGLRLDLARFAVAPEFVELRIELPVVEFEDHSCRCNALA